jgi:isopenicillin-N N-acyltransferase-like protein
METIRSLTVGEDAFERGRQHGEAFKDDVVANLEIYFRRFEASGMERAEALRVSAEWRTAMAQQNEEYSAEMMGIAAGADLPEDAIALLNARYELAFTLFGKDARSRNDMADGTEDGCTTFGILPEAAADGQTWLGQNWDWLEGLHGRNLVLRVVRSKKPSLICLTEAGIVGGKMGVNECGIGLVENGLASSHDGQNAYRKPFHMRCREVLDADRYDDALRAIIETNRTCSANFVIGAAEGEIVDLETSPNKVSYLYPEDGIVTHSNHFLTSGHGESQMEKVGPSTVFRASRMRRLLEARHGRLGLDAFKEAMSDHFGAPNALCRHPDPRLPEAKRTMTTGAVIIELGRRIMHVANGPPCSHPFVPFALNA